MPRRRFKLDQPSIFSNFCILGFKLSQMQPYEELFKPPPIIRFMKINSKDILARMKEAFVVILGREESLKFCR